VTDAQARDSGRNHYDGRRWQSAASLSVSRAIAQWTASIRPDMEIETDAYGNAIFARAYLLTGERRARPVVGDAFDHPRVLYDRASAVWISATNTLGHTPV
jgi:hypothetical protein